MATKVDRDNCPHMNFNVQANVNRVTDGEGGPVIRHQLDLTVWCHECGTSFEFIGMVPGCVFDQPSMGWTWDGRPEARIPIRLEVPRTRPPRLADLPGS